MSNNVLTLVIVGPDDHPIFESDLAPKPDGREVIVQVAVDTHHIDESSAACKAPST